MSILEDTIKEQQKTFETHRTAGEFQDYQEEFTSNSPLEIVIRPELIDSSELAIDEGEDYLWRPSKFEHYMGQDNLKNIIQARINGCQRRKEVFPHMLIDGSAGSGKTTIALLTAKYLDVPLVETIANVIRSPQQFIDKLVETNGGVLFIDELHEINCKVANFILPILEDFKINGQRIKPFTLFGATTEKGILLKKYKPLVDRMKLQNTLEPYTINELTQIIKQFKNKSFANEIIDDEVFKNIAINCRATPRIGLRILENFIFMNKPIDEVLKTEGIIKDGLTKGDFQILKLLNENIKGVGLKAISSYIGTSETNYLYQYESYLLQQGFITITNRRQITNKGKEMLCQI